MKYNVSILLMLMGKYLKLSMKGTVNVIPRYNLHFKSSLAGLVYISIFIPSEFYE